MVSYPRQAPSQMYVPARRDPVDTWQPESNLSTSEALAEAMNSSGRPSSDTSYNTTPPTPHLPLRKTSARRLRTGSGAPRSHLPLFAVSQDHRGFQPSPVEPLPHIDNVAATSTHPFGGGDEGRRPFRMPLGVQALRHGGSERLANVERPDKAPTDEGSGNVPSSPLPPPPPTPPPKSPNGLRSSKSMGEGLRSLRQRLSSRGKDAATSGRGSPDDMHPRQGYAADDVRASFKSALTSNSSFLSGNVSTDRSSQATWNSSHSDFVKVYPDWPETEPESMSVEDAIGMYADGFESANQSLETQKQSMEAQSRKSRERRPRLSPLAGKGKNRFNRRSQSASLLERVKPPQDMLLLPPKPSSSHTTSSADIVVGQRLPIARDKPSTSHSSAPATVPRDRYGFKKASHYVTVAQYDAWNAQYTEHIDRRRKKWQALMRSYGLDTENPIRFPPKSDKIKRYVRKGIPPEWRGAAWFWYAGGPGMKKQYEDLYWHLIEQTNTGKLSDNDREHIERDLHRTFPDNMRFKPDPTTTLDTQSDAGGGDDAPKRKSKRASKEPEVSIVRALRRVLQAFAIHNPNIGYCQSLNFIAGLLLLFLDEDEEKAFILLNIVTTTHLPGTHGVALEGANVDIAVLMSCVKECLPSIWAKLDDKGPTTPGTPAAFGPGNPALRLPTVSLATTAWFMSLFVGTLPIEPVLRVWDCLFFEGSKTLFRIALAIFKSGEKQILAVNDPMEIFQVVQTIPRGMLDANGLMEVCFKRRGGFGGISQGLVEQRREERRKAVRAGLNDDSAAFKGKFGRWRSKTKT